MRKLAQASTVLLLSGTTTAMAAGVDTSFGEARLFWRTSFSEQLNQSTDSRFGATLDYDRRYSSQTLPGQPAAQVNFDRHGFVSAAMNGLPFARRVTLQQAEGEAPAGSTYTAVDYTLLAIGAVGIGFGISEVVNQKDTPDRASSTPAAPPGSPPASPGGLPLPLPLPSGFPSGSPLPLPLPLPGLAGGSASYGFEERSVTPEYQSWLDQGTGGMGDLVLIKE